MYLSFFPDATALNDFIALMFAVGLAFHVGWDFPEGVYLLGSFIVRHVRRFFCKLRKAK